MFFLLCVRRFLTGMFIFCLAFPVLAMVMKPDVSMVMINEDGGSLHITNTGDKEALIYIKVHDLQGAKGPQPKLLVIRPLTRVAAGKTRRVNFIMTSPASLHDEYRKKVVVESIFLEGDADKNKIATNFRLDLPVIIHPKVVPTLTDAGNTKEI